LGFKVEKGIFVGKLVITLKINTGIITSLWSTIRTRSPTELLYLIWVNLFGLVISLFLYILKPFKSVKLLEIRSRAIGQQAGNTGLFLRRLQLENERKSNKILYIGISGKPDNAQLLKMFKRNLFIIQSDFLDRICSNGAFVLRWSGFFNELPFNGNEYYEFNNTEPDLQFTSSEEEEGRILLNNMGIDDTSWFVCFHCRDSAFSYSYAGDFRNSDIKNYLDAAKYITSCGGFAVRMGQTVTEKLPDLNNPRIIDYANKFRSDFGDIYLSAKCKFFLGSTAGLFVVSAIFNVPIAGTNFIPFHTPFRTGDLFIPKKIWSVEEKRLLTFREYIEFAGDVRGGDIRQGVCMNIYADNKLSDGKYVVIENTSEEILDLAMEINERLDGTFEVTEEDEELQKRFHSLLYPDDCYYGTPARIGSKFLRQNKELLT
jgi:putative glycosyltransferase (TIGR04372 family)